MTANRDCTRLKVVGIVLRIEGGPEVGVSHAAKAGEVKIGRTKENDLVIKDPAASRAHARVFERAGKVYVEDLGSANGTRLNDEPLAPREPVACEIGDDIGIGDTVIRLVPDLAVAVESSGTLQDVSGPVPPAAPAPPGDAAPEGYEPTRPKRPAVLRGKSKETVVRAIPPIGRPDDDAAGSMVDPAFEDAGEGPDEPEIGGATRSLAKRSPAGRAPRGDLVRESDGEELPGSLAVGDSTDDGGMSAAARARMRRELARSVGGRAQLLWDDLPAAVRGLLVGSFVLACAASVALVGYYMFGSSTTPPPVEPNRLVPNGPVVRDSFGLSDPRSVRSVMWIRGDKKAFNFKLASATQVVGVLHFGASDISEGEVMVSLNGSDVEPVPPDTTDSQRRELEIVFQPKLFKNREDNTVLFDNTKNPPGSDTWAVAQVWLEVIPIPELSETDAVVRAKEALERAQRAYDSRDVASGNLFRAWKTYREAWLLMEAMENPPRELQAMARGRTQQIRPELDHLCNTKSLEFHRAVSKRPRDYELARTILTDIPTHFPSREHWCLTWSEENLKRLQDISHQVYTGPVGGER